MLILRGGLDEELLGLTNAHRLSCSALAIGRLVKTLDGRLASIALLLHAEDIISGPWKAQMA